MVASQFIDYLTKFQINTYVGVEDFADKFNFLFTVIILLLCTSVVTVKQYVLKPISCYMATDIGGFNLLEYVENYCWVEGTVPITYDGKMPSTKEEWDELNKLKILYYQWVPFLLALQCIMFYIPRLCWQIICYNQTGTDLSHLITSANQAIHSSEEAKSKMIAHVAKTIEQMLFQHRDYRSGKIARIRRSVFKYLTFFIVSKRQGTRLIAFYFLIKLAYLSNCILQLYFMQRFLSPNSESNFFFGFDVIRNISLGRDWKSTLIFPRVGYCYVNIDLLGSKNSVTAQCVLPVNMLNEKIFFFLWCWILTSAVLVFISTVVWIFRLMIFRRRKGFIYRYLKLNNQIRNIDDENCIVTKFENQFLRNDGIFLLRMIAINTGDVICAEIVCSLWKIFKNHYVNRNFLNDGSDEDDNGQTLIRLDKHIKPISEKLAISPTAPDIKFKFDTSNSLNSKPINLNNTNLT